MQCEIPMIKFHSPIIFLKQPTRVHTFPMNEEIESNISLRFLHNSTQLSVNYSASIKNSCSGNLCDRQRVTYRLGIKVCGCYGISTNSTRLVVQHAISMKTETHSSFHIYDFSSLRLS